MLLTNLESRSNLFVLICLQGELLLEKSIAGHYIKVPCIDHFGSCTYESLCDILQPVECPDEFNKAGVPCKCPFKTVSVCGW